ncbi:MAG: hypothetical protein AB7P33_19425 [Dehalococcoidia bacterium]
MDDAVHSLVEAIHASPVRTVLAVTGAGSQALAWLLGVGGASRTVLEATIPYAQTAFIDYAGRSPGEFASPDAASALAGKALERASILVEDGITVVGIGCAATIATDRLKRGEHHAFVSWATTTGITTHALHIEKGARDRAGEEALVSRLILNVLAEASGVESRLPLDLRPGEQLNVVAS